MTKQAIIIKTQAVFLVLRFRILLVIENWGLVI